MHILVLYFFQLVLGVFSQFTPDMTNKRIGFSYTFFQKGLKLVPYYGDKSVVVHTGFVLLPSI